MSQLLLNVMGAFSDFERDCIRSRQQSGIELAKKRGVYRGRKPKFTLEEAQQLAERVGRGESKAAIAKEHKVSRVTLYAALRAVGQIAA